MDEVFKRDTPLSLDEIMAISHDLVAAMSFLVTDLESHGGQRNVRFQNFLSRTQESLAEKLGQLEDVEEPDSMLNHTGSPSGIFVTALTSRALANVDFSAKDGYERTRTGSPASIPNDVQDVGSSQDPVQAVQRTTKEAVLSNANHDPFEPAGIAVHHAHRVNPQRRAKRDQSSKPPNPTPTPLHSSARPLKNTAKNKYSLRSRVPIANANNAKLASLDRSSYRLPFRVPISNAANASFFKPDGEEDDSEVVEGLKKRAAGMAHNTMMCATSMRKHIKRVHGSCTINGVEYHDETDEEKERKRKKRKDGR